MQLNKTSEIIAKIAILIGKATSNKLLLKRHEISRTKVSICRQSISKKPELVFMLMILDRARKLKKCKIFVVKTEN